MSSNRVKDLQRLSRNLGPLQHVLVPVSRFQSVSKSLDGIAACLSAHDRVLRGMGAMVSSHHGIPLGIRYNGAVQYKWRWFV